MSCPVSVFVPFNFSEQTALINAAPCFAVQLISSTRTVPSEEAIANLRPSGLNAAEVSILLSVTPISSLPDRASHTRAV
jgi:hypothetical protein